MAVRRLRRLNAVATTAFVIGGALFAAGVGVAQFGSGDATETASIYFAGGLFSNTGGYASLLQVINAPRHMVGDQALATHRWRWWNYEPTRVDWLSVFLLFTGALCFSIGGVLQFFERP
ncbi:hypothetical protein ACFTWS_27790 [Streptomyces sp. NPDC057027]|uniref:hypothetical protein n=1 Tax=Streptomyces sp. NPDC057027 TaxID=3346004 RepID=UPI0036335A3F